MKQEKWINLLKECNFKDTLISGNDNLTFLIQTRKSSINEIKLNSNNSLDNLLFYNNIILYGIENNNNILLTLKSNEILKSKLITMNCISQINQYISNSNNKDQNLIIFIKSISTKLNINNFKDIQLEFIQINQLLLKSEFKKNFNQVLITNGSTLDNYLSSSLVGSARYFYEFSELNLLSLDLDNGSIGEDGSLLILNLNLLLNSKNNSGQKEFIVKDNNIYYERFKRQTNIQQQFKSKSFETNKDSLMVQLDLNLEYKLKSKRELKPNEIEIEIKANGINYKDYLMYIGMIGSDIDIKSSSEDDYKDLDSIYIGNDFSGIVSRVGSKVTQFKLNDQVFGVGSKTSSSHIIVDYRAIYYKPSNITHTQAASLPSIYITNLHSIYSIGNLQSDQAILIHSATGGVGLSALELLRSKNHQGYIFVTVGSEDKATYLKNKYGSLITGIYSSRDKNFVENIKDKLISLNSDQEGVDLILNTLSSEYMDSNFKCLNQTGHIVDLSITHLNQNEFMDYGKFKFNYGYSNVEIVALSLNSINGYLKKIFKKISTNELNLIPVIEFSNDKFKESIEFINQRKHIGKIVVNHNSNIIEKLYHNQISNGKQIIMKQKYDISNLNLGKNILLTGQMGLVLEILKWLTKYSNQSIENIIILSKSKLKWELEYLINQTKNLKNNIIKFHFNQVDVENNDEINNVLNQLQIEEKISNIDTVIHFAFTNDICDVQKVDMETLDKVHGPKTIGAINLHNQSIQRNWNIKQFILASSSISIFSSNTQLAYVSSCNVIDSLSKYRKSIGLPSLSINIGAITSTGFVSRNESIEEAFKSSIFKLMTPQLLISSLDLLIQNIDKYSNYVCADIDFESFDIKNKNLLTKFDYQVNQIEKKLKSLSNNDENDENISNSIISKISEILTIEESKINIDFKLNSLGLDSLVIVQLKNWIDNTFGHNLITIQQLQNNTISTSINIIKKELNK